MEPIDILFLSVLCEILSETYLCADTSSGKPFSALAENLLFSIVTFPIGQDKLF